MGGIPDTSGFEARYRAALEKPIPKDEDGDYECWVPCASSLQNLIESQESHTSPPCCPEEHYKGGVLEGGVIWKNTTDPLIRVERYYLRYFIFSQPCFFSITVTKQGN